MVSFQFYISVQKVLEQLGDILLSWSCASVLEWYTHYLQKHQLPIEQKPTTIGFIIYKHSTDTKLYHPVSGRSEEKLSIPRFTEGNPKLSLTIPFLNQHQKWKKIKSCIYPQSSLPLVTSAAKRWTHLLGR